MGCANTKVSSRAHKQLSSTEKKYVDEQSNKFDAYIGINDKEASSGSCDWRPEVLSHKMIQAAQGKPVVVVDLRSVKHSAKLTNAALPLISRLPKPETGFENLRLAFQKLEEKIDEAVLDNFVKSCQNL